MKCVTHEPMSDCTVSGHCRSCLRHSTAQHMHGTTELLLSQVRCQIHTARTFDDPLGCFYMSAARGAKVTRGAMGSLLAETAHQDACRTSISAGSSRTNSELTARDSAGDVLGFM